MLITFHIIYLVGFFLIQICKALQYLSVSNTNFDCSWIRNHRKSKLDSEKKLICVNLFAEFIH